MKLLFTLAFAATVGSIGLTLCEACIQSLGHAQIVRAEAIEQSVNS